MSCYAGIAVSLEQASVCVVDGEGRIVREEGGQRTSGADRLVLCARPGSRTGGVGSRPLVAMALCRDKGGWTGRRTDRARHVRAAFQAMPVKTDRKDARGIAQLMRLGWFRPVHCKTAAAQEARVLLTARKLVQSKLFDVEMSLRGILRGFGLKVGRTTVARFAGRIRELVAGHATLETVAGALLAVHAVLARELSGLEKRLRRTARADARVCLLMSAPGVGAIVGLTFASAIDDPCRFRASKRVGTHFGLTPKKYQSGERDVTGRISKVGDPAVRAALYGAAHVILTRPIKASGLESWAMRIAKRAGMEKAEVALARKLAVILHRMLADGRAFRALPAERRARR